MNWVILVCSSGKPRESGEDLPVDQASDSDHTRSMVSSVMAVGLLERLVTPQSSNGMFDLDAVAGKSLIEFDIFRCPLSPPGFEDVPCPCPDRPDRPKLPLRVPSVEVSHYAATA